MSYAYICHLISELILILTKIQPIKLHHCPESVQGQKTVFLIIRVEISSYFWMRIVQRSLEQFACLCIQIRVQTIESTL